MHGRRGAHSYYGNIGKQFPRSPSSTNRSKISIHPETCPLADGATSSHVVLLAPDHPLKKCASLHSDSLHQRAAKLCDSLLGNWLLCGSCLPTQDESSICRLQRNQELKSCGGERECNILRLSLVLVTLRRKPCCRVIMLFFCKR